MNSLLYTRSTTVRRLVGYRRPNIAARFSNYFSSSSSSTSASGNNRRHYVLGATVAGTLLAVGISIHVRKWRHSELEKLPKASTQKGELGYMKNVSLNTLISDLTRTGLMGHMVQGANSVKEELDCIRKWHMERDYKGGLVLRDLEQPLFGESDDDIEEMLEDPMRLARRECYYLYYERLPSAEIRQEIFCRGTTLKVDILTCLQFWYVYDEELDANLHLGFRNHAERLVNDMLPMLVKDDPRATIHVHGHSLGGAVASIVALKLIKRGYKVTKVTTAASPRFSDRASAHKLSTMLPKDSLRIEDDRDLVPFLPPFGVHLQCHKLWLIQGDTPRFIPKDQLPTHGWVDSVWTNFRMWEVLTGFATRHRMRSHVKEVEKLQQSFSS